MSIAGFDTPAEIPPGNEDNEENTEEVAENNGGSQGDGDKNDGQHLFDDDSSSDDDMMVTIGEIKKNAPFQKQTGPVSKVDMDGEPEHDGKVIYDLDLAAMEEKPWQKPGADVTDYFNYGFTEETWNLYCERQRKLRSEYGTQKEINRVIMAGINLNSTQINIPNLNMSGGRHLVNLAGPERPQKANKMIYDLSKPPTDTLLRPSDSEPSSPDATSTSIQILNFNKPPESFVAPGSNTPMAVPSDGPPGVDGPPGDDTVAPFDVSVPPPNFNPNVPPPNIGGGMMNMPPPMFNAPPMHVSAGFGQGPTQYSNRPPPLMGRQFPPPGGFDEERAPRYRRERDDSEDDGRRRRRRHSRSASPKRRKEERDYERDRDRDRDREKRSKRSRDDRERRRSRDRDDSYDKDKKRSRKHERERSRERSSRRTERSEPRGYDSSIEAPPGIDDLPPGTD
ncbi:unnamed protein product [Bursaphelenchus xylophilus]|uniref:(pine wood nematode) hypothetical protein n=1 Tax=Bursaphelenchus xylophilus TaxID=6326 RepID=A0A1I7RI76_BURXY|nr:unnamed protein product [Bursaphelenchus xylophilus]CAG9115103.1 unnamed protein product [Bursaphelenchus xylophilus]